MITLRKADKATLPLHLTDSICLWSVVQLKRVLLIQSQFIPKNVFIHSTWRQVLGILRVNLLHHQQVMLCLGTLFTTPFSNLILRTLAFSGMTLFLKTTKFNVSYVLLHTTSNDDLGRQLELQLQTTLRSTTVLEPQLFRFMIKTWSYMNKMNSSRGNKQSQIARFRSKKFSS